MTVNEVTTLNATVRTGVRRFYNLFTAGLNPTTNVWSYGYGLGTTTAERRGWLLALEGTAHQLNRTGEGVWDVNLLLRLSPVIAKQFDSRLGISFGPTLNGYYSNGAARNPLANQTLLAVTPDGPDNDRDEWSGWLGWLGWQVGVRARL